jgi:hypothetical protein
MVRTAPDTITPGADGQVREAARVRRSRAMRQRRRPNAPASSNRVAPSAVSAIAVGPIRPS